MRAETALRCALLLLVAAALPAAALAAPVDGQAAAADHPRDSAVATPTAGDERTVHLDVQLLESGNANWTVRTYVPIDGGDDRAAFEELGRRYVNGTADVGVDADLFRRYVDAARSAADRPMRIREGTVERNWTVENGTGVLVLRFTWENFAREESDRLVVDDAFETPQGTWLPSLESGQVLTIRPPEGLGFIEAPKATTNGTLRWEGPRQFGEDYFRVVYLTDDEPPETPTTPPETPTTPPDTPTETPSEDLPAGLYLLVALVGGGGVAAYLLVRRGPDDDERQAEGPSGPPATAEGDGGAVTDDAGAETAPDAGDDPGGPDDADPEGALAGVDVEMLSDEERVLRLLEANGGRMKQAQIVRETDWSNAKVSQLLSGMDEDGAIDKLRIGRENLISLPDVDVDSMDSP